MAKDVIAYWLNRKRARIPPTRQVDRRNSRSRSPNSKPTKLRTPSRAHTTGKTPEETELNLRMTAAWMLSPVPSWEGYRFGGTLWSARLIVSVSASSEVVLPVI